MLRLPIIQVLRLFSPIRHSALGIKILRRRQHGGNFPKRIIDPLHVFSIVLRVQVSVICYFSVLTLLIILIIEGYFFLLYLFQVLIYILH